MTEQSAPVAVKPTKKSSLPVLGVVMALLSVMAVFIYANPPKSAEYVPVGNDIPRVKTAKEIEKNLQSVKNSNTIPSGEKGRIIGFLQVELEQARQREGSPASK